MAAGPERKPTATHSVTVGHDTPASAPVPAGEARAVHVTPESSVVRISVVEAPVDGSIDDPPTATQVVTTGHDTAAKAGPLGACWNCQLLPPSRLRTMTA